MAIRALVIWGSGSPRREFLHVDDAADALVHLMHHYSGESHVNVGAGTDITILQLASLIAKVVGFRGRHNHRYVKARWHPTQAARCIKAERPRVGTKN